MPPRHHGLPRVWLMTDDRMGAALWPALARLPRGAGVVFRHYGLPVAARRAMFGQVARIAARRRLTLLCAGDVWLGRGAHGVHGRRPRRGARMLGWPAHDRAEVIAGIRAGADVIFVSPVFATRSHPGARPLGRMRAMIVKQGLEGRFVALGGIGHRHQRWVRQAGFYGWAGIDAWTGAARD